MKQGTQKGPTSSLRWVLFISILLLVTTVPPLPASDKKISEDCTFNGIKLHGKVQFVSSFPDIKIQAVCSFPDLKVKMVESFPDSCGEWQVVDSFPDFKVQFVESFPDIKIKFVSSFPGLP